MNGIIETLNGLGAGAVQWAWPMLWQSSVLILLLLAVEQLWGRKLRPGIVYALWLVVLVKLVLPPSLALPSGVAWWLRTPAQAPVSAHPLAVTTPANSPARAELPPFRVSAEPAPVRLQRPPVFAGGPMNGTDGTDGTDGREANAAAANRTMVGAAPGVIAPAATPWHPAISWQALALVLSALVSLGLGGYIGWRWVALARLSARGVTAPAPCWLEDLLEDARREAGVRRCVRVRLLPVAISPALFGLFRPVILLPVALVQTLSPEKLRSVLLHELIHLRRWDLWVSIVQAGLQILCWWHPLLWVANTRIRRVREEAVDEAVLVALEGDADSYAPALLEVARLGTLSPLASVGMLGMVQSKSTFAQRIGRIVDFTPPRRASVTLSAVVCAVTFGALALPMGEAPGPKLASGRAPNGTFTVQLVGEPAGNTWVIEASTNLVDWAPVATNVTTATGLAYTDPDAAEIPTRFYRAYRLEPVASPGVAAAAAVPAPAMTQPPGPDGLPRMLDLGPFYVTKFEAKGGFPGLPFNVSYDGLPFYLGGQVELWGKQLADQNWVCPTKVEGIPVKARFDELHIMHDAVWEEVQDRDIALVRLNYADGRSETLGIKYGVHVSDWNRLPSEAYEVLNDPGSKIVWRGPGLYGGTGRLFKTMLQNPRPDVAVESMDVISTMTRASWRLVAATLARRDPNRVVTLGLPLNVPAFNYDGAIKVRVVDQLTGAPMVGADVFPFTSVYENGVVVPPQMTGPDGTTTFKYPVDGTTYYNLRVTAPGYAPVMVPHQRGQIPKEVTVQMRREQAQLMSVSPGAVAGVVPNQPALYTRSFKIDVAAFTAGLQAVAPSITNDVSWNIPKTASASGTELPNVGEMFIRYLASKGVNLMPPRTFYCTTAGGGTMLVRGSLEDVEKVQQLVRELQTAGGKGAQSAPTAQEAAAATKLVSDGRILYEAGKLDEAEKVLREAIKKDPRNNAAYYYLNLIKDTLWKRGPQPQPGAFLQTLPQKPVYSSGQRVDLPH